ncbi:amino acid permease [Ktedonobacter robiniae]|uniref:amino acid permease n=1 Tax=Ktedonobacter robiniae TaxID=2778365 RepID=UPI001915AEB0|nr:amino acid permease [Ktedonobacter robiniae]
MSFYWMLGLVMFLLPSLVVFSWLLHQAPRHVPLYVWILRLLHERWRSVALFLACWIGVLMVLASLGICLFLLQHLFPPWFDTFFAQCLVFAVLLVLETVLTCLPLHLFRRLLWIGGVVLLAYPVFFLVVALLIGQNSSQSVSHLGSHPGFIGLPAPFPWSLFGLTVLNLFGLNGPLLLDGEMRGPQRFLRRSTSYLWWGGLGAFLLLFLITVAWFILNPTLQMLPLPSPQLLGPILGPRGMALFWLLTFLGDLPVR